MISNEKSTAAKTAEKLTLSVILFCALVFSPVWASEKSAVPDGNIDKTKGQDIAVILEKDPRAVLFTNALKSSNLWQAVQSTSGATLFVPTDTALQTEGSAFLLEVVLLKAENNERLNSLVAQHLVPGRAIEISELTQPTDFTNELGGCLPVAPLGSAVKIGPEAFVTDSTVARNGNIYFIDRLLWQPYQEQSNCAGD